VSGGFRHLEGQGLADSGDQFCRRREMCHLEDRRERHGRIGGRHEQDRGVEVFEAAADELGHDGVAEAPGPRRLARDTSARFVFSTDFVMVS